MVQKGNKWVRDRLVFVLAVFAIVVIVVFGFFRASSKNSSKEVSWQQDEGRGSGVVAESGTGAVEPVKEKLTDAAKEQESTRHAVKPLTLNDIIRARRTWGPIFTSWYGRAAPDFDVPDIDGSYHRLSDYRGKDVLIILWGTWCPPCHKEIPHLIALRNIYSEADLAMLAITFIDWRLQETPQKVREFVRRSGINYTVVSVEAAALPGPYNRITGFPSAFFIDKRGKIKFATEGALSLGEMKAILRAEE